MELIFKNDTSLPITSSCTSTTTMGHHLRWSNLKKRVALGKQRIGPRIQASGTTITQDLQTFGDTFNALHSDFCGSRCMLATCSAHEARSIVGHFEKQLGALRLQARDLIELQELLETNVFNFSRLKECVLFGGGEEGRGGRWGGREDGSSPKDIGLTLTPFVFTPRFEEELHTLKQVWSHAEYVWVLVIPGECNALCCM